MPPRTIPMTTMTNSMSPIPISILDRIRPIEQTNYNRLKCSFYGDAGTGKTRLLATFPKPILLLATEVGTDSIVGTPGIDVAPIETAADYYACLDHVVDGKSQWTVDAKGCQFLGIGQFKGSKYRTIGLDTASKLRKNRIIELFKSQNKEVPRSQPFLYAGKEWKDVWQQCSYDLQKMLSTLLSIPDSNECCVVVNSHEANLTYSPEESNTTSEFLKPNISSAVGKAVADFLNAEVSYMGQMLIRDKFDIREEKMGELSNSVKVRIGAEYVMRVGPDAIYRTKFRQAPTVTKPLPDFLVNPTYDAIVRLIKGDY